MKEKRCFYCRTKTGPFESVYGCSVCANCAIRIRIEQEEIYDPLSLDLYDHVKGGEWKVEVTQVGLKVKVEFPEFADTLTFEADHVGDLPNIIRLGRPILLTAKEHTNDECIEYLSQHVRGDSTGIVIPKRLTRGVYTSVLVLDRSSQSEHLREASVKFIQMLNEREVAT